MLFIFRCHKVLWSSFTCAISIIFQALWHRSLRNANVSWSAASFRLSGRMADQVRWDLKLIILCLSCSEIFFESHRFYLYTQPCLVPQLGVTTLYYLLSPSVVHWKLDYCNSLYYSLSKSQITRLQHIENSLARAVVKAPKSCHITPILCSLHWLKIASRVHWIQTSLTYL